jgi:acyl-CoA synthetase (AMP-forming)/AMP-acid ligase II
VRLELILEMAAEAFPKRTAISLQDRNVTYAELLECSRNGAYLIRKKGAGSLAYVGDNHLAFPVGLFAASIAGIPFVPMNYRLPSETVDRLASRLERPLVLSDGLVAQVPSLASLDREEFSRLAATSAHLAQATTDASAQARRGPEEPAVILFTSGTTKEPKAAVLRHKHLMSYLVSTVEFGSAQLEEAALVSVPPYHVAGIANLLSNLYAARRIIYLPAFDASLWIDTVQKERVTHAMVVPTMLARIVEEVEARGLGTSSTTALRSLRTLAYGGSKVPRPALERALLVLDNVGFVNAYGLTETSSTICVLGPEEHRLAMASQDPLLHERLFSVGRPVEGVEIQIVGESGNPLAPGQTGRIAVRGQQVSGEYAAADQADRAAQDKIARILAEQGWFLTGDLGHLDDEGYLFIEGRGDDTIIRGGENIAPAEIEDVLLEHPSVTAAAAVGLPDDEWGQRILAAVVPKTTATLKSEALRAELLELCRKKLRSSRMPERIEFVQSLPMTDTGKVRRRELLAMLEGTEGPHANSC